MFTLWVMTLNSLITVHYQYRIGKVTSSTCLSSRNLLSEMINDVRESICLFCPAPDYLCLITTYFCYSCPQYVQQPTIKTAINQTNWIIPLQFLCAVSVATGDCYGLILFCLLVTEHYWLLARQPVLDWDVIQKAKLGEPINSLLKLLPFGFPWKIVHFKYGWCIFHGI